MRYPFVRRPPVRLSTCMSVCLFVNNILFLSILLIISDLKWCIHLSRSLFIFQLLGECHCWWTSESPRAHVAKFYGRLRLIRSVWEHQNFPYKIDWNCNFVGLLHHPFWLQLVLALSGQHFLLLKPLYLAKDHWWGFITRNAHMVHIVNYIRFKMVYTS